MVMLYLQLVTIVFQQVEIDRLSVGQPWAGHAPEAHSPIALVPLANGTPAKAACICRVVKGGACHVAPVHELAAWITGKIIFIKNIQRGKIAGGQHKTIAVDSACHPVEIRFHGFAATPLIPGLAQEQALPVELGGGARGAGDFTVVKAAQTHQRTRKRHTLGDFGVEVQLAPLPRAKPEIACE